MAAKIDVRGLEIGSGIPKIIAPIVGTNSTDIMIQAQEILKRPVQMIEWRADFFEHVDDVQAVLKVSSALRETVGEIPVLFTLRTTAEGGQFGYGDELYSMLNLALAKSGNVDLVDVEIFGREEVAKKNIEAIHSCGICVVGSNHNFHMTPAKEELVERLCKIQDMDADILKIAVMPNTKADVAALLSATAEMYENYAKKPLITMSMGPMGVISRIAGEAFGSSSTFGSVGQASAPGQMEAERLFDILSYLHSCMGNE